MSEKPLVVVVGAGVIGLSTAILLLESGQCDVQIVARDLPHDIKTLDYTSPWAGAHHISVATGADMRMHQFDMETFKVMSNLIESDPKAKECLFFSEQIEYREKPLKDQPFAADGTDQITLLSRYHPDFKVIPDSTLPKGVSYGVSFTAILIDTPHYLPYLVSRFESLGGQFHRSATLPSLSSALSALPSSTPAPTLLINCTGLGSRLLSDVKDEDVFPTRGQLVIVRAPWVGKEGRTILGEGNYSYTIPRPKSGTVILGGSADANDWDPNPREALTKQIKERCLALQPELLAPEKRENGTIDDLDVVELAVGLRPTRKGGIRLEVDEKQIDFNGHKVKVIHEYGHGGYGYQSSWGSAQATVELVKRTL